VGLFQGKVADGGAGAFLLRPFGEVRGHVAAVGDDQFAQLFFEEKGRFAGLFADDDAKELAEGTDIAPQRQFVLRSMFATELRQALVLIVTLPK